MHMSELLGYIKTKIAAVEGINEVQIVTRPLPTPKEFDAVFLIPGTSEKVREGSEEFYWMHPAEILVVTSYNTTQEDSLIHATAGLMKLLETVHDLLENDMLTDDSGVPRINSCELEAIEYATAEARVVDNIYCRAGTINYMAQTKPYKKAVS